MAARLLLLALAVVSAFASEDPDVQRNITEIIQSKGYPVEEHEAVTEDGYILTMFRIPYGAAGPTPTKLRPPVLLQHGLLDNCITWVINEPSESLGYILADAGYDVWLGNNRGSTYALKHVTLTVRNEAFWEFSWDEMAQYDFPAQIAYALNVTGASKVSYIGHSEGTIQAFAALSTTPALSSLLASYVGFGPVTTTAHATGPLAVLAQFEFDKVFQFFGLRDFAPTPTTLRLLFGTFCFDCEACCSNVIELICGQHQGAFNESRMDVVGSHEPGGTSVQNMAHWAQGLRNGTFLKYSYGSDGNLKRYGQTYPPVYPIGDFPTGLPTAIWSGLKDILADPTDCASLRSNLPSTVQWTIIPDYAHLDFIWALDAKDRIYPDLIKFLNTHAPTSLLSALSE